MTTTAASNGSSSRAAGEARSTPGSREGSTRIHRLADLVGAHPDALRSIFRAGQPTRPADLGEAPRGRVLAFEPTRDVHFLVRPLLMAAATRELLWQGKTFGPDGSGANVVLGRPLARFVFETEPSALDGKPALVLRYDFPLHNNLWPLRNVRDELRTVADGIAIGPAHFSMSASGERKVLLWFGLER